jgi:hypothetical protein
LELHQEKVMDYRDCLDIYEQEDSSGNAGGTDNGATAVRSAGLGTNKAGLSIMPGKKKKKSQKYPPRGNSTELDTLISTEPSY